MTPPTFPKLKRYEVTVSGYGAGIYVATSRGKAMADAWRCDAFGDWTFKQFLMRARCVRTQESPEFGKPCTVEGKPALYFGHNTQYVSVQLPGRAFLASAHPYDVLPVEYRPRAYRDRHTV